MLGLKSLVLPLLALTASAAPTPDIVYYGDSAYEWQVTNWSAGCARAGCYYGTISPNHKI
jgi:hypothetical protein